MSEFIFQGSKSISEDDFKSHLSSLCQLENIGVLLGAGASAGCGGMTMAQVWTGFKTNNSHQLPDLINEFKLINAQDPSTVNVELLLDQVTQFLSVERIHSPNSEKIAKLESILLALYQSVTKAALLVGVDDFDSENVGAKKEFDYHRELLEKLISNRQPGQSAPMLFTTNCDLSLEWSAEEIGIQLINGFTGLHTRTFQPQNFDLSFRNVNAKGEARW
jgi:hypothetical protein